MNDVIRPSNENNDEPYCPPAFRWTLLPPEHPERMKKVLAYINAGAGMGIGSLEWDTIKAALQKCSSIETGERRPFAGLKSLSFDVSETPTIALVIRFDNIEHAQAARDQLWQPPTPKANSCVCGAPEVAGLTLHKPGCPAVSEGEQHGR